MGQSKRSSHTVYSEIQSIPSSHTVYSVIQPSSYTMTGDQINSSASKYLEFWFKKCTKIEEYHGIAGIYQRTMDDSWTKEPLEVIQGRKNRGWVVKESSGRIVMFHPSELSIPPRKGWFYRGSESEWIYLKDLRVGEVGQGEKSEALDSECSLCREMSGSWDEEASRKSAESMLLDWICDSHVIANTGAIQVKPLPRSKYYTYANYDD